MKIYNTVCKIDSQREFAVRLRELRQGLCDNLQKWEVREGAWVHVWLILVSVCQKTTTFCEAIIPQLKKINYSRYYEGNNRDAVLYISTSFPDVE